MFQAETRLREAANGSKASMDGEVACLTCFMPSQDLPCTTGKASQNLFASVGLSDTSLGMKHAAWRAAAASERGHSEGEFGPALPGGEETRDSMTSELERLLNDDLDNVIDAPAALAPVTARPDPANKYDDILPYFDASRDDTDTDMCTTCWNVGSAMDERRNRSDYELPPTAMALGSSKMMSKVERDFVQTLISGGAASLPEPEFSEEAATAARLAGMSLPTDHEPAARDDASSVTSSEAACDESDSSRSSGEESAVQMAFAKAATALAATATSAPASTRRVAKRSAESMSEDVGSADACASAASAERSAMSTAVAGIHASQPQPVPGKAQEASKRPKRAAASRATELARQALMAAGEEEEEEEEGEHESEADNPPRGVAAVGEDDEAADATYTARGRCGPGQGYPSAGLGSTPSTASAGPASVASRGSSSSSGGRSRGGSAKGRQLPEWSVHVLKEWLLSPEHFDYPWPTAEEKEDLASRAGIDERQLGIWLTNARKRLWMPLRKRQGLSIPRYSDAKSERVQRALVERVQHEAVKAGIDSVPAAAPAPARQVVPAPVDPTGLARVMAALRAEEAQLRVDERSLAAQRELVALRSSWLSAVRASQHPGFVTPDTQQSQPFPAALPSSSSSSSSSAAAAGEEHMHCVSSFYMQLPPSEHVMLSSVPPPLDPMQPDWDGSDLAADDADDFGAFGLL